MSIRSVDSKGSTSARGVSASQPTLYVCVFGSLKSQIVFEHAKPDSRNQHNPNP